MCKAFTGVFMIWLVGVDGRETGPVGAASGPPLTVP